MLLFVAFAAVSGADPERLTPVVVQLAALKSLEYALPGVALAWPARAWRRRTQPAACTPAPTRHPDHQ
jgi:hypothetical protein